MGDGEIWTTIEYRPVGVAGNLADAQFLVSGLGIEPAINFTTSGNISVHLKFEADSDDDATLLAQPRLGAILTPSRYRYVSCRTAPAVNNPRGGTFDRVVFRRAAERLVQVRQSPSLVGTLAFIDIEGSTKRATELGDEGWAKLLSSFRAAARAAVAQSGGNELKDTGDGFLLFWPGAGVDKALAGLVVLARRVREIGLSVRAGVHWGEFRRIDADVGGIEVHTAARVTYHAVGGQIVMTGSARDLLSGDILVSRPSRKELRDVIPRDWYLYTVGTEALA